MDAWARAFADCPQVRAEQGDYFRTDADAVVSPANSFGFMDGGLDLVISQHLGWGVEDRVRAVLMAEHEGELPVGQAFIVPTDNARHPWLVFAPTMRVPMNVAKTAHAFLAMRAILRAVRLHSAAHPLIRSVLCPGLGTGNGCMPPKRCAKQMRQAYAVCVQGEVLRKGGLAGAARQHMWLVDAEG